MIIVNTLIKHIHILLQVPSDCREVLCPTVQIRNAEGTCTYPMTYTYINGYSIALRLVPEKQDDLIRIYALIGKDGFRLKHFSSPWPSKWNIVLILLENTRLMSSGALKNETSFLVKMRFRNPNKNQTRFLENIRVLLKEKWMLNIAANPIILHAEILEYTRVLFNKKNKSFEPYTISIIFGFDQVPNWKTIYLPDDKVVSPRHQNWIEVTEMFFCHQIILDPLKDAYELMNYNRLLYLKDRNKYIFEANFIFNLNGQKKVRVCLQQLDFVQQVTSAATKVSIKCVVILCALGTAKFLFSVPLHPTFF